MEGDVSKRTIVVLVVLTVIISMLGTLSVLSAVNDLKTGQAVWEPKSSSKGEVSLTILESKENEPNSMGSTTGRVALEILEKEQKFKLPGT